MFNPSIAIPASDKISIGLEFGFPPSEDIYVTSNRAEEYPCSFMFFVASAWPAKNSTHSKATFSCQMISSRAEHILSIFK